jgi:hypothetical protein
MTAGKSITGDRLGARGASFGKQVAVTLGAVRIVVLGGETLTGQLIVAIGASETFLVPRIVAESYATSRNDLFVGRTDAINHQL